MMFLEKKFSIENYYVWFGFMYIIKSDKKIEILSVNHTYNSVFKSYSSYLVI